MTIYFYEDKDLFNLLTKYLIINQQLIHGSRTQKASEENQHPKIMASVKNGWDLRYKTITRPPQAQRMLTTFNYSKVN